MTGGFARTWGYTFKLDEMAWRSDRLWVAKGCARLLSRRGGEGRGVGVTWVNKQRDMPIRFVGWNGIVGIR